MYLKKIINIKPFKNIYHTVKKREKKIQKILWIIKRTCCKPCLQSFVYKLETMFPAYFDADLQLCNKKKNLGLSWTNSSILLWMIFFNTLPTTLTSYLILRYLKIGILIVISPHNTNIKQKINAKRMLIAAFWN